MDTPATRLRAARLRHYASASEAARAHGWKISTYTHHENGTRPFGKEDAVKYGRAFGVKAAYLMMLAEGESNSHPSTDLPTMTEAAVGVWREESVDSMSQQAEKLRVPSILEWRAENEYAVQVRDRSLDKFIVKDEYAVCRPIRPGPVDTAQFDVNDFLHIERIRRGLKEISIRRIRAKDGASLRLATYSNDAKLKSEITYPAKAAGESVILRGVVVGKYFRIKP